MTDTEFTQMADALRAQMIRFPGCIIANCECQSRQGEWRKDCRCMCHFAAMDAVFGKDKWTISDFEDGVAKRLVPHTLRK